MEGEQHHYELRSRSRSRSQTPQVLNRNSNETETPEHHYDLRSRSRERSHTPGEVTSSRRSGSRSLPGSVGKSAEKSMETISERKDELESQNNQNNQTTKSSSVVKKVERRSERQKAKQQIFSNGQSETNENKNNSKTERERQSLTPRRVFTSDYSSEEGDQEDRAEREDPPSRPGSAHEIYKRAGDWWNVFPKTDYTYSQKSQCRYEIAPGIMAMPNMSRRSIHSDTSSTHGSIPSTSQQNLSQSSQLLGETNSQIGRESVGKEILPTDDLFMRTRHSDSVARSKLYKTTHVEQYSSRRELIYSNFGDTSAFQSFRDGIWADSDGSTKLARRYEPVLQADSDVDIDDTITTVDGRGRSYRDRLQKESNIFIRIYTSFVTYVVASYTSVKNYLGLGDSRRSYSASYSYRQREESRWSKAWRSIDRAFQYLYALCVSVLFLDTWLLSRAAPLREGIPDRRKKLMWIVLLPLLLLGGLWLLYHVVSNFASIPSLATYPATFLSSIFYSDGSIARTNEGSNIQAIVATTDKNPLIIGGSQNYGWKDEVVAAPLESGSGIDTEKEKELDSIISLLVERVKNVERANLLQSDALINIKQEHHVLITKIEGNADLKKYYDDKLAAIELKLEEKEKQLLASSNEDINAIKIELNTLRALQSELKSCCEKTPVVPIIEVEKHVNNILAGYFGEEDGERMKILSKEDLAKTIKNLFIAKNDLEARIASLNSTLQVNAQEVKDLADKVMADITEQINTYTLISGDGGGGGDGNKGLTERDVRRIVTNALKIYDADKTGRVDYALESAGGQILSTRCTQKYNLDTRAYTIYGYILFYQNTQPQTVIQGDPIQPGKCWVFQDFPGYLLIRLRTLINVTGFTIEHAPRSILPNSDMRSAPRKFNVWGYNDENDKDPVQFGEYEFKDSDESLQYFPVQNAISKAYDIVELRIHSNHGQIHYTSLYRFRVHGIPA